MIGFLANPVYGPFLTFLIISFIASFLVTIIYKLFTNQILMKQLKDDIKKHQDEMRSIKDTQKLLEIQKKAMDVNMKYMMESFKPTFITFIPIILLFWWIAGNIASAQIMPNEEFGIDVGFSKGVSGYVNVSPQQGIVVLSDTLQQINQSFVTKGKTNIPTAVFRFKGDVGEYTLRFDYEKRSYEKKVIISNDWNYAMPELKKGGSIVDFLSLKKEQSLPKEGPVEYIKIIQRPVHPFGENFTIFGWKPGWVATYIIFSLIISMLLRKILNLS
jgi:uncharacterized membrane protein (DUF106 family)